MHQQPQLTCTARHRVQAPDAPHFHPESGGPRGAWAQQKVMSTWVGVPRALQLPPPPGPGRGYCAGRQALPWAQTGAPIPWLVFCWNHQRGGKREVRRDTWDPWDAQPHPRDTQIPNTSVTELLPGRS